MPIDSADQLPQPASLIERFDRAPPLTVGIEEEVMLLDPATLDLAARAPAVLDRLPADGRFKLELPAAQLEIVTRPTATVTEALAGLARGRRDLAAASEGLAVPAAAGAHPFAAAAGELNRGPRYDAIHREYGAIARRQLVSSLQVHVAVGGARRSLAVYNALRCLLPEIAALAANAPYYEGADTGLASIRPSICIQLPRQGIPPAFADWEALVAELQWGARAASVPDASRWWWELRPHVRYGTLEVRTPDAQTTLADAGGLIAFVQALVADLAERHDAGEPLPTAPLWRIQENRWSAMRHGLDGILADVDTGERTATRERLAELVERVEPAARRLGSADLLVHTRALLAANGAVRQREEGARSGPRRLARWLADRFLTDVDRFLA